MWFANKMCLLIVISLAQVLSSTAQNEPQNYIAVHNAARAQVGVGPMTWDGNLATHARNYAKSRIHDCKLVSSGGPYGENLAVGSSSMFSGVDAVNSWVAEKQYYNHSSNSCAVGKVCSHYTQVVWKSSTILGCARTKCTNGLSYFVCSYDPRGNFIGKRPY